MLRWIFTLVMFFLSRRAPAEVPSLAQITQNVTEKIQTALVAALAAFFLLLLSMMGFVMTLFVLAQQYDRDGVVSWSATLSVGLGLLILPLLILGMSGLRARQGLRPAPQPAPAASGLPQALEELAVQWMKDQTAERRFRRQQQAHRGSHDHSNAHTSDPSEEPS
ncbi:MAG: hypothetical protein KF865_07710 [Bdellovibrionaceae bacterium]|nr:hypothetical protein [Pseudobdellovibrionaceae bacterium]